MCWNSTVPNIGHFLHITSWSAPAVVFNRLTRTAGQKQIVTHIDCSFRHGHVKEGRLWCRLCVTVYTGSMVYLELTISARKTHYFKQIVTDFDCSFRHRHVKEGRLWCRLSVTVYTGCMVYSEFTISAPKTHILQLACFWLRAASRLFFEDGAGVTRKPWRNSSVVIGQRVYLPPRWMNSRFISANASPFYHADAVKTNSRKCVQQDGQTLSRLGYVSLCKPVTCKLTTSGIGLLIPRMVDVMTCSLGTWANVRQQPHCYHITVVGAFTLSTSCALSARMEIRSIWQRYIRVWQTSLEICTFVWLKTEGIVPNKKFDF